jgi:hypothetical protein
MSDACFCTLLISRNILRPSRDAAFKAQGGEGLVTIERDRQRRPYAKVHELRDPSEDLTVMRVIRPSDDLKIKANAVGKM